MIKLNGTELEVKQFPNGESFMDVSKDLVVEGLNHVEMKYASDLDIVALVYISDFIAEKGQSADLLVKSFPYSRMDRKEENRLFTLKSIAKLINSLNFKKVTIWEPHSDVSVALIDRVEVVDKSQELTMILLENLVGFTMDDAKLFKKAEQKGIYLVYPDAGAAKRYGKQFKGFNNVIEASKERDFNTGDIKKIDLVTDFENGACKIAIIVDDMCDKGGTFLGTAKLLKEKGVEEVYLVVTHCLDNIFNGAVLTSDLIKQVITTDSCLTKEDAKIRVLGK